MSDVLGRKGKKRSAIGDARPIAQERGEKQKKRK